MTDLTNIVRLQDTPAVAKEISIAPPMTSAHQVHAIVLSGDMDPLQKLVRIEDVLSYADRILAAAQAYYTARIDIARATLAEIEGEKG